KKALEEIATVAKPETILAWHRKLVIQPCANTQPPPSMGRPRIDKELEDLVVRMARENRSRGYDRIVCSLLNLCYRIIDQTVGNILKRHGIPPAPERKKTTTWREEDVSDLLIACQTDTPNSYRLTNRPITKSCMRSVLEKQIVRRTNRLIRVRMLMCLLSIFWVFAFPTVCCSASRYRS